MTDMKRRLITAEVRFSFAKLVVAEPYKENGKAKGDPKFGLECICAQTDFDHFFEDDGKGGLIEVNLPKVVAEVAKAKWPDIDLREAVSTGKLYWPIVDGNTKIEKALKKALDAKKSRDPKSLDHYKDKKVFRAEASEEYPPVLAVMEKKDGRNVAINLSRASDTDMNKAKQAFKGGNYGRCEITVVAVETAQGRFMKFYLNSVRMTRTGDPIGSGGGMMARFDGISGGSSDHNPTDGLSDSDIPF